MEHKMMRGPIVLDGRLLAAGPPTVVVPAPARGKVAAPHTPVDLGRLRAEVTRTLADDEARGWRMLAADLGTSRKNSVDNEWREDVLYGVWAEPSGDGRT